MDRRLGVVGVIWTVGLVTLSVLSTAPTVAGASCSLNAPASVQVGVVLTIHGAGFPSTTTVELTLSRDGDPPDVFTADSDSSGAFAIELTTEPSDVGLTTVVAKAGSVCTARATYHVLGATATATATAAAAAAARSGAPRTDAALAASSDVSSGSMLWMLGALTFVIGVSGLWIGRTTD